MPQETDDLEIGRTLAAAADASLALNSQQLAKMKEAGGVMQTCLAGLIDYLEDPLKSRFLEIKNEINQTLAGLPDTDKVPAALQSNNILAQLLSMLTNAQDMITSLAQAAKAGRAEVATARASVTAEVEKAITAKVTAGDLLTKESAEKLANDRAAAARDAVKNEQKVLGDRTRALASANLPPTPSDEVLAGKDEEFAAKQERAKARNDQLKGFTIASATLSKLVWQATDDSFNDALGLLKANKPASGANPFAVGADPAAAAATITATASNSAEFRKKVGLI